MPHLCRTLGIAAVMSASLASAVAAQDIRPSAYGAAGFGSVFRVEDQRFGTKLNLAVGPESSGSGLASMPKRTGPSG